MNTKDFATLVLLVVVVLLVVHLWFGSHASTNLQPSARLHQLATKLTHTNPPDTRIADSRSTCNPSRT